MDLKNFLKQYGTETAYLILNQMNEELIQSPHYLKRQGLITDLHGMLQEESHNL